MMWDEVIALKRIVRETSRFDHINGEVVIRETGKATLCAVTISGLSAEGITLKPSSGKDEQFFVKNTGGKRCDYIILSEYNGERVAVFLDMKSDASNDSRIFSYSNVSDQLRATVCFLKYVSEISKSFCKDSSIDYYFSGDRIRYAVISGKGPTQLQNSLPKTREKPNITPDNPKICYVEDGGTLPFEKLFTDITEEI